MKTLDKNKAYGTVHGGGSDAAFEQGGVLFDTEGNELGGPDGLPAPSPAEKRKANPADKTQGEPTANSELEAQLAANLKG